MYWTSRRNELDSSNIQYIKIPAETRRLDSEFSNIEMLSVSRTVSPPLNRWGKLIEIGRRWIINKGERVTWREYETAWLHLLNCQHRHGNIVSRRPATAATSTRTRNPHRRSRLASPVTMEAIPTWASVIPTAALVANAPSHVSIHQINIGRRRSPATALNHSDYTRVLSANEAARVISRRKGYFLPPSSIVTNVALYPALFHPTWRRDSDWGSHQAVEVSSGTQIAGFPNR